MNKKINQIIKYGNNIRESIANKKIIWVIILMVIIMKIEFKIWKWKRKSIESYWCFCKNMDLVLNKYESKSETILSICNINSNK